MEEFAENNLLQNIINTDIELDKNQIDVFSKILTIIDDDYIYNATFLTDYFDNVNNNYLQYKSNIQYIQEFIGQHINKTRNSVDGDNLYISVNNFCKIEYSKTLNLHLPRYILDKTIVDKKLNFKFYLMKNNKTYKLSVVTINNLDENNFKDTFKQYFDLQIKLGN